MIKKITLIYISFLLVTLYGCQYHSDPRQILIESNTFTIVWDPPDFDARTIVYPIEYYRIYYRELGSVGWNMIAFIPGVEETEYRLHYSDFGSGRYEFAVDYIQSNGQASQLHTSGDRTTVPIGGWYIVWLGLE